jgi:hypothetical protein
MKRGVSNVVSIQSMEHPAVRSARLAIIRHLKTLPASAVFSVTALTKQLARCGDGAHWLLSADHADKHPEQFEPRKGGA